MAWFSAIAVFFVGTVLVVLRASRYRDAEGIWLIGSWVVHLVALYLQFWILRQIYGNGDALGYFRQAAILSDLMSTEWVSYLPELVNLLLQRTANLPLTILGAGSPSGSMAAVVAFLVLLVGRDATAVTMAVTLGATFGNIWLYDAFREAMPQLERRRLLWATCLIPSVVFWSSSLLKEAVVLTFLGPLILSTGRLFRRQFSAAFWVALCLSMIGLIKPYILLAYLLGAGAWLYWQVALARDGEVTIRPIWALLATSLAIGGVVALGRLFPAFAADQVMDSVLSEQAVGQRFVNEGSGFQLGGGQDSSLVGQLVLVPIALLNAWFRPSIFDARNAQMLVNALETTAFLLLFLDRLWRLGPRAMWRQVAREPILVFSLVFAVCLGVGVGLTTSNFGTLSRYRMPLVPFLAALVAALVPVQRPGVAARGAGAVDRRAGPAVGQRPSIG